MSAVREARPDAVIHQLTAIPPRIDPRKIERDFALERPAAHRGHAHLVAAAQAAGAARILAQSIAFAYAPGPAGTVHGEDDPADLDAPPAQFRRSAAAIARARAHGARRPTALVLRYGYFYGPRQRDLARRARSAADVARRRLPIVGGGAGRVVVHPRRRRRRATVAALDARRQPAPTTSSTTSPRRVREWLPALAAALGAQAPAPRARRGSRDRSPAATAWRR